MKSATKTLILLLTLAITSLAWGLACETPTPVSETTQEATGDAGTSDTKVTTPEAQAEPTPEPTPEPRPEPRVTPLAWDEAKLESKVLVGVPQDVALPALTGGSGDVTYKLKEAVEGVTLEEGKLKAQLSYKQDKPTSFVVIASKGGEDAELPVTLTPQFPVWNKLPTTDGPPARANPAMALAGRKLLVLGGFLEGNQSDRNLWFFDRKAKTWTKTTATGTIPLAGGVFRWAVTKVEDDGTNAEGIVLQSMTPSAGPIEGVYRFSLKGDAVTWTKLTNEGAPVGLVLSACGVDTKTQTLYLFSGLFPGNNTLSPETYSVKANGDKAVWTKISGAAPPPRYGAQFGVDHTRGRLYVASGTGAKGPLTDIWMLHMRDPNGPRWEQINAKGVFLGRQNGALLVDAIHNRIFVWGGSAQGVAPLSVSALNLEDKEPTWADLGTPSTLTGRTSISNASDPVTGEAFFGFGRTPTFIRDVWSFHPNDLQ